MTVETIATYDEAKRAHQVNGLPTPSVTQILRITGVSADFSHVDPIVLDRKRQIGQAVHAATHYFDEGDLDAQTLAPEVEPYLEAWRRFRLEREFVPDLLETVVYSLAAHYIGRFDRLGYVGGLPVLLDIKIGDPDAASADLQTAGYLFALLEERPHVVGGKEIARWSVQLTEDGRYRLRQYPRAGRTSRQDRADFLALARAVNLRQERSGGQPCWM